MSQEISGAFKKVPRSSSVQRPIVILSDAGHGKDNFVAEVLRDNVEDMKELMKFWVTKAKEPKDV